MPNAASPPMGVLSCEWDSSSLLGAFWLTLMDNLFLLILACYHVNGTPLEAFQLTLMDFFLLLILA
jgi:hypothetical protein